MADFLFALKWRNRINASYQLFNARETFLAVKEERVRTQHFAFPNFLAHSNTKYTKYTNLKQLKKKLWNTLDLYNLQTISFDLYIPSLPSPACLFCLGCKIPQRTE